MIRGIFYAYKSLADFGRAGMWVFSEGQESFSRLVPFAARYQHGRWAKARLPGIPIQVSAVSPTDI